MKLLFLALAAVAITSCSVNRDIQVHSVDVELVKIDTVFRNPNAEELVLTWRSSDNLQFVSFEPARNNYLVGSRMRVLLAR